MNKKSEYTINIEYDAAEKCYIARVPELGEFISAFGNSYEDALKQIKKVIQLTLQSYEQDGVTPPKPKSIRKVI